MTTPGRPRGTPAVLEPLEPRLLLDGDVIISEFLAINDSGRADQDGEHADWIEIYNPGLTAVNLDGWYLTDDSRELDKWRFPAVSLSPHDYLLVFASEKDRAVAGQELHTNFRLAGDGEYLALVRPDGATPTSEYAPFPRQRTDISFYDGRYFLAPTPEDPNGPSVMGFVGDTAFSVDRGFYDEPFDVSIVTDTPGATIIYTTDGSEPTETHGDVYLDPVPVRTTTVLRAAAFKAGYLPTNVDTQTYIFLQDVLEQDGEGYPAFWGRYVYGGQAGQLRPANYGVDPDVVNDPRYRDTILDDLRSIPTMSLVLDPDDLWNSATGIYTNPLQEGIAWERPGSVELIDTDGRTLFQVDAGLRIHGGWGRRPSQNSKHSFRLLFKDDYGPSRLEYPLFGEDATDEFDTLVLRAGFNDAWRNGETNTTYLQDRWTAQTQNDMGGYGPHGTYVHLYVNGMYWGLYNPVERPNAAFAASYFGGEKEDYDCLATRELIDGNSAAWDRLTALVRQGTINYDAVQQMLDIPEFIDYMVVNQFGGNWDWPHNNWYATYNRAEDGKWRFHSWDAEGCLQQDDLNANRVDAGGNYGPGEIYLALRQSAEFRLAFADRVHRHFFNGGALTPQANIDRLTALADEIDRAIVGESARWGDGRYDTVYPPRTRDDWLTRVDWLRGTYLPQRSNIVLSQYRAAGLYPGVVAPSFSQHGGGIQPGFVLAMTAPDGAIYYTTDGSDPRLPGGAISPTAVAYAGTLTLTHSANVKARVLRGGQWSALNEAGFRTSGLPSVRITEIMYNPPEPTAAEQALASADNEDYEYVELMNVGQNPIGLGGMRFTEGVAFTFPAMTLAPGQRVLVVQDALAMAARYGSGLNVAGTFESGRLSNGGEPLALQDVVGTVIHDFAYDDAWHDHTDGLGFSLVVADPLAEIDLWARKAGWSASATVGGSPGAGDPDVIASGAVVISEALTHTDEASGDWIELHNTTGAPIDVGGWFLSDSPGRLDKYEIAPDTWIEPGDRRVFTQRDHFGIGSGDPGVREGFGLSEFGEAIYLSNRAPDGSVGGYREREEFGAADREVTFGLHTKSTGGTDFVATTAPTLGTPNAPPVIGPVVINEIMYNPAGGYEFIELLNVTGDAVPLYDPLNPANTWRFDRGVTYEFPQGASLPAGGYALVVPVDPGVFRAAHGIAPDVLIFGPFTGLLDNGGETVSLERPGAPDPEAGTPYVLVEKVTYDDEPPWPTGPDGTGTSLERLVSAGYGNDLTNWMEGPVGGTPGARNDAFPPQVVAVCLNGRQGRSVGSIEPSGIGIRTVEITFSEAVTFGPDDVVVQEVAFDSGAEVLGNVLAPTGPMGSGTSTMRIEFPNASVVDTWVKVTLRGDGTLRDRSGLALDGDPSPAGLGRGYVYAEADLPTGDGASGGDAVFYLGSLRADLWGVGFYDPIPDGRITLWDINAFTSKYGVRDPDADLWGTGHTGPYTAPNGLVNAWDAIRGFVTRYQEALTLGRHLDPLPAGGAPLAARGMKPLLLAPDPEPALDLRPAAAGVLDDAPASIPVPPASGAPALTVTAAVVPSGRSSPAPEAAPADAIPAPDGEVVDLLAGEPIDLPIGV